MKEKSLKGIVAVAAIAVTFLIAEPAYSFFITKDKEPPFHPLDFHVDSGTDISIKENCFWDNPGNKPWKGDNVQLLRSLELNEEEINSFLDNYKNDRYDSIIQVSARSIIETSYPYRLFKLNMDMSSGKNILCKNTYPGRNWEYRAYHAKLFVINDKFLAVPEICGNLTRMYLDSVLYSKPKHLRFGYTYGFDYGLAHGAYKKLNDKPIVLSSPSSLSLMLLAMLLLTVQRALR